MLFLLLDFIIALYMRVLLHRLVPQPMSYSSNVTSFPHKNGWMVSSWVQNLLGACLLVYMTNQK